MNQLIFWIIFNLFVVAMVVLDLGLLQRRPHPVKLPEAAVRSLIWVALAGCFALLVYFWHGKTATLEFATGYLIELSLSVDNLFVFLVIFRYFHVAGAHQHKVLFWGILGALFTRGIFILAGIGMIRRFHWIIYAFGSLLIYSGIRLFRPEEAEVQPEKNPVLRLFRRLVPITKNYVGGRFFVKQPAFFATPLFVVLLVVETTDVVFAADSIPAVLAITRKGFIIYTSNVFAILGLRSMYFALAGMMEIFDFLHYGLACVLIFVGAKMLVSPYYNVPTQWVLALVGILLSGSVLASVLISKSK